jgi:chromosome partitioning protein
MTVLAITQRKGGNGKSTAAVNLGAAFAEQGKRTLLIDLDDQKNTTGTIPVTQPGAYTVEHLLFDQYTTLEDAAAETHWSGVDLIAGSEDLSAAAAQLERMADGHKQLLKKLLYSRSYNLCLIDTSPSLNMCIFHSKSPTCPCEETHMSTRADPPFHESDPIKMT